MKLIWTLAFSIVLLGAASPAQQVVDNHYKEGQRLFGEKSFEAALDEFLQVDSMVPDDPQVNSWIAACLNELGRYAEAKKRLENAIRLVGEKRSLAIKENQPVPAIDIGYFALLARIQLNLGEFEQALATINSYPFDDDGSPQAAKTKQAIDIERQTLKTRLVVLGSECLNSGDLDCARTRFTQADTIHPATPTVREWFARESWLRAEKAPGATDEDKAKKRELHQTAVIASRIWIEEAGPASTDAQRILAKALVGTKTPEGYQEAIRILTSLWTTPDDPAKKDSSIQRDLAVAHAGLEQWELAVAAASMVIELDPDDPLGQGYCLRSFGQYHLGKCQDAINDGRNCKNADGSPRSLKYLDTCQHLLTKHASDKAQAAKGAKTERECGHLHERIQWARSFPERLSVDDLVKIIAELKSGEARCKSYLEAAERKSSGNGFSSPTPILCAAGVKTASLPLNLSQKSNEELEALRGKTQQFLTLCRPMLNATQVEGVGGGLLKIEKALE